MAPNVTVSDAILLDSTPRVFIDPNDDPNDDDELDNVATLIAMTTQNSPSNSEVSSCSNHSFSFSATSNSPPCPPTAPCSTCLCPISLTKSGLTRIHGPTQSRYLGSNKPPAYPTCTNSSNSSQLPLPPADSLITANPVSSKILIKGNTRIVKRIPRASRPFAAEKLTSLLVQVVKEENMESYIGSSSKFSHPLSPYPQEGRPPAQSSH